MLSTICSPPFLSHSPLPPLMYHHPPDPTNNLSLPLPSQVKQASVPSFTSRTRTCPTFFAQLGTVQFSSSQKRMNVGPTKIPPPRFPLCLSHPALNAIPALTPKNPFVPRAPSLAGLRVRDGWRRWVAWNCVCNHPSPNLAVLLGRRWDTCPWDLGERSNLLATTSSTFFSLPGGIPINADVEASK